MSAERSGNGAEPSENGVSESDSGAENGCHRNRLER